MSTPERELEDRFKRVVEAEQLRWPEELRRLKEREVQLQARLQLIQARIAKLEFWTTYAKALSVTKRIENENGTPSPDPTPGRV